MSIGNTSSSSSSSEEDSSIAFSGQRLGPAPDLQQTYKIYISHQRKPYKVWITIGSKLEQNRQALTEYLSSHGPSDEIIDLQYQGRKRATRVYQNIPPEAQERPAHARSCTETVQNMQVDFVEHSWHLTDCLSESQIILVRTRLLQSSYRFSGTFHQFTRLSVTIEASTMRTVTVDGS